MSKLHYNKHNQSERKEELYLSIVIKRNKMIELANTKGLLNKETIKCSQELDALLNKFQAKK
ncbi:aspartyl-phosphate phosphatase Spo0E family protein [Bacillus sp. MMSF_3328]|uniref:aspartyl-phosphate phosphatase Spo0E family protein n=1 Tax=Bacillus sp. MMSF_3328 TaxID=3047080 RepID=UPI00273E1D3D|nr:aspartyl-phosphate phosphatase Spo0E family protein [Bacillus sp. MMSF_3328]